MSDLHRPVHKMPFKWRFPGGPPLARTFMFSFDVSFDVSFDIMRRSTIIFFREIFWYSKETLCETVLLSTQNLR